MSNPDKLRILAIHGYRQSDLTFRAKLGSLRKSLKKEVDFVFVKAPHKVPPLEDAAKEEDSETEGYGWWFNTEDRVFRASVPSNLSVGFKESVALIEKAFQESGPFDGVIGFSQGASFVSILCAMQEKKLSPIQFDFAILISGFKSLCEPHAIYYNEVKFELPTLHVYGEGDKIIPTKMAAELLELFSDQKKYFVHDGGHYVPGKKHIYNDFIKEMLEKKSVRKETLN